MESGSRASLPSEPRSLIRSRAMRWSERISASKRAISHRRAFRCSVVDIRCRKARPAERAKEMPKKAIAERRMTRAGSAVSGRWNSARDAMKSALAVAVQTAALLISAVIASTTTLRVQASRQRSETQ